MKFDLYKDAVLMCDLPEHRLRRGDIVKLVDHHTAPDGSEGYSIEVFNALGDTIAVTAVATSALETLREDEVLCTRTLYQFVMNDAAGDHVFSVRYGFWNLRSRCHAKHALSGQ